ncbi:MAG: triose-phosphate isomerase [Candidatus Bipolaricaulota bacterium]|nr:triose-phosphate isomerase [Candidatus Bipolaricaulota bacterium]
MGRERRRLLVANWKMHFVRAQALEYLKIFTERVRNINKTELVLAPPFTLLETVGRELQKTQIKLAAQNLFYERQGAFTGEISPLMLKDLGCHYVIVGHSERRRLFGETDEIINKKLRAALDAEIAPILCVGETLEERRAGRTQQVLEVQIRGALHTPSPPSGRGSPPPLREGLGERSEDLVIAYEPVWAIGTGVNAEPHEAEANALFIRELLAQLFSAEIAQKIRILYGGSVNPANFEGFLRQPNIDGALVGGASLDPEAFAQLAQMAERLSELS